MRAAMCSGVWPCLLVAHRSLATAPCPAARHRHSATWKWSPIAAACSGVQPSPNLSSPGRGAVAVSAALPGLCDCWGVVVRAGSAGAGQGRLRSSCRAGAPAPLLCPVQTLSNKVGPGSPSAAARLPTPFPTMVEAPSQQPHTPRGARCPVILGTLPSRSPGRLHPGHAARAEVVQQQLHGRLMAAQRRDVQRALARHVGQLRQGVGSRRAWARRYALN